MKLPAQVKDTIQEEELLVTKIFSSAGKLFKKTSFVRFFFLSATLFTYFLNPAVVAADFLKVTAPSDVALQTSFDVNLEISAKAETTYSVKVRLGSKTNDLSQGQTFSSDKNVWLSDTVSWSNFPTFKTDSNGMWSGKVTAQTKDTMTIGQGYLVVRIRDDAGKATDSETYYINVTPKIEETPVAVNPSPVVTTPQGEPILNEFVAQPAAGSEWVELKNIGKGPIDLSNWWVDDEPGKSSPQAIAAGTVLAPNAFLVVEFKSAKLNDLADEVRLLKPDQTEVETYTYDHTEKGSSWSKDKSGTWFLTANVTKGAENADNVLATPAAPAPTTSKVVSKTTAPASQAPESDTQGETLGVATSTKLSDKTATVAANFIQKPMSSNNFFSAPLFVLGTLCFIFSAVFVFKRKLQNRLANTSFIDASVKIQE